MMGMALAGLILMVFGVPMERNLAACVACSDATNDLSHPGRETRVRSSKRIYEWLSTTAENSTR